jgi:hypothetical protein
MITNYTSAPLTVSPNSTSSSTPPPITYTPASQFGTGLGSPHSDKRSLDSPDSHKGKNKKVFGPDLFVMSAACCRIKSKRNIKHSAFV